MQTKTLSEQQKHYLDIFMEEYVAKTRSSQARREGAWPALADPRSSQNFSLHAPAAVKEYWLATKGLRYPIVADYGEGAYVWDIDGNRYTDFCLGFGVHLFGHRPAFVEEALRRQLDRGLPIGFQSGRANEVATAIAAMTGAERVAFCNTGTEAVMGALRLARAATKRDRIAVFSQSFHGAYDTVVPALGVSLGVSASQKADTLLLEYGAPKSLEEIAAHAGELAGVLVEPVQGMRPDLQPVEFLRELRKLTREKDIALIFDDVLVGFRIHQGGSQAYFNVRADLATYGKIIGGGMPIGTVTGAARFMDQIDGGRWSHHGDTWPAVEKIWFSGTFNKNPMTMAAAHAVVNRLQEEGNSLQEGLNEKVAQLTQRLSGWLAEESMPVRIGRFGSMFRLMASPEMWLLVPHLRMRGIYVWDGMSFFISTAHRDENLKELEDAIKDSLLTMRKGGFIA